MSKSKQKKFRKIAGTPFWIQPLSGGDCGMFARGTGCLRIFLCDPRDSERQFDLKRYDKVEELRKQREPFKSARRK